MFELTIDGNVYQFNFGIGFLREVNKKIGVPIDGVPDVKKNVGLQYMIAGIMDGDVEELIDALDIANKGYTPRVTKQLLDSFVENPETDIDKLFDDTVGFFEKANATKKTVEFIKKQIAEQKKKK